jgi:hypothetical protein
LRLHRSSTIESGVRPTVRCVTVAIAIVCWIGIFNHCAFSAIAAETGPAQNECPFHSKPSKQKDSSSNVQCCKILRATVATAAKSWARDHTNFSNVDFIIEEVVFTPASHSAVPLLLDTGPPGKTSFAELIGSMRAHAPPLTA